MVDDHGSPRFKNPRTDPASTDAKKIRAAGQARTAVIWPTSRPRSHNGERLFGVAYGVDQSGVEIADRDAPVGQGFGGPREKSEKPQRPETDSPG